MNKFLRSYIDLQIIDEYATKDLEGYHLDIDNLPSSEKTTLIEKMFENDSDFKELVLEYAQNLIDSRIPIVESQDRYDEGYRPHQDPLTGEVMWVAQRGGAY